MIDYGLIDSAIVCSDVTPADVAALSLQADVVTFPADLDTSPTGAERNALGSALEASFIPAQWLSPADSWRTILRTVTGMFLYMQRLTALAGSPLGWGVALNTRFNSLAAQQQAAIAQAASDLQMTIDVSGNPQLRMLLKNAADQWGARPIYIGAGVI